MIKLLFKRSWGQGKGGAVCFFLILNLLFFSKHLPGHPGRGALHPLLHQLLQGVPPLQGGADREGGMETHRPRGPAPFHIFHPLPWKRVAPRRGGSQQGPPLQPGPAASAVQRHQLRAPTFLQRGGSSATKPGMFLNIPPLKFVCIHSWDSNLRICLRPTQRTPPLRCPSPPHLTATRFDHKHNNGTITVPLCCPHTRLGSYWHAAPPPPLFEWQ